MRRLWMPLYALLTTALLFWCFNAWAYDDIFITYRYAANLASGAGMVYNPGERVLSTTAPLWVLLLSPVAALGWDVPAAARLLGAFSLAAGGYSLWQLGRAARLPWVGWSGLLFYPLHPLVTGTLGSETPLYLALGLGALALHAQRRDRLAAACAGLAAVARPDGLLFALVIGLDGMFSYGRARREGQKSVFPWQALVLFGLVWLPWMLWAGWYYGSPLPVTLAAKQGQAALAVSASFWRGFWQTLAALGQSAYFAGQLILAGAGGAWLAWRLAQSWRGTQSWRWLAELRGVILLFAWTAAYFCAYVALGVTRYFWYYAPLLPALAAGMGLGLEAFQRLVHRVFKWIKPQLHHFAAAALAALVCLGLWCGQVRALQPAPEARIAVYRQVGEWLAAHTQPADRVGVLEVGVIGYYARRPMVDFAGLLQPEVAAQLSRQGSYERTARWAVQRYQPEALVLHDGLFPELESWLAGQKCAESARFPGLKWDMVVYTCGW